MDTKLDTKRLGGDCRKDSKQLWRARNKRWLRFNGRPARGPALAKRTTTESAANPYVLEIGEAAAYRLSLLQRLYGPGTCEVLQAAGLCAGMRVADVGCGIGTVTALVGELVGQDGLAVGFDMSEAQLAQARERTKGCEYNISFVQGSATDIRWASESFDLVYSRFLLMHLPEPEKALAEMCRLLKPGGILVCEDGDLTTGGSEPPSALGDFADLFGRLGPLVGVDYTLGRRLFQLVRDAGFEAASLRYNQPVAARGEQKRLLELSIAEAGPALIESGLLTAAQLERTTSDMQLATADTNVVAVMPRITQVWARKPAV
jgi:SAM-dependent methyltransferase